MSYIELHAHSYFSLLDGASSPDALLRRAAELGMPALALTDHDAVYGAVQFVQAARAYGVKPVLGAEMTLSDGHHLTLLVENERGWQNLCQLISHARANAPKGQAALPVERLEAHTGGLIALSGCRQGAIGAALLRGDPEAALAAGHWLRERFGPDRLWIELQHHLRPEDRRLIAEAKELAGKLGSGYLATNNVHYARRESHRLQDILVCTRHGTTLRQARQVRRPNSEYYLKAAGEMARLFGEIPEALANTLEVAERCQFTLEAAMQELPHFPAPDGMSQASYLRRLCEEALSTRYPHPPARVRAQLDHELAVIERSGLVNYFLIMYDIVRFAREQKILCQGRGSACNSLVAYLLAISPVDPLAHNLVFERFLSEERQVVPDIDIDFAADRREEVIQYVYRRYGAAHVAMACTFSTYRARGAIRDVGKVLELPPQLLNRAVKSLDGYGASALAQSPALRELAGDAPLWQQLLDLAGEIVDVPRHLGLHNGGMVLTGPPLISRVPTEPAAMVGRTVVQWDKDSLEESDLIKLDILGLRMLSAIAEAVAIVEAETGRPLDLQALTFDDPAVYEMIGRADTIGCFQVESRAQAQVLPRLRPRCFNDLVISISLIRPGPLQGQMVHPYLRRREGEEPVLYAHPLLEPVLADTLGVILFQEQVLLVAKALAGFTPGQGELLRRALGKKHATEAIERFRAAFTRGAISRGVERAIAEEVFEQLKAFGSYSFARSHAAAFSVLVYWSAWLKHYHHAAFSCALLNNQPMGFWSPAVLVNDARRHGVRVLPVDINLSGARCAARRGDLQIGLSYVNGLGESGAARVVDARQARPFATLAGFCRRTRLPRRLVEHLIRAGAMDGWKRPRRQLLWELGTLHYQEDEFLLEFPAGGVVLPPLSPLESLDWEHEMLGLSTGDHLLAHYRPWLASQGILDSCTLEKQPGGRTVRVAGQVVIHQAPPTARGFHFLTLEDEFGLINVIVRPDIYTRYRAILRNSPLLVVEGTVQHRNSVTNLTAQQVTSFRRGCVN